MVRLSLNISQKRTILMDPATKISRIARHEVMK